MRPVTGSPELNKEPALVVLMHADGVLIFELELEIDRFVTRLTNEYHIRSQPNKECVFTGQGMSWQNEALNVDQARAIEGGC